MFIGSSSYLLAESGVSPGGEWHISWRRVACLLAESGVSPGGEWRISWRRVAGVPYCWWRVAGVPYLLGESGRGPIPPGGEW